MITKLWHKLLIEFELAKNYQKPYLLSSIGAVPPNPLMNTILPSLIYVKMVSILDEAFKSFLKAQSLPSQNNLKNTINAVHQHNSLSNHLQLHAIREKRNEIAHEVNEYVTWAKLETDLNEIQLTLEKLGLVKPRPNYEFFAERSQIKESDEPNVAFVCESFYGLTENDEFAVKVSWVEKVYK